MADPQERKPRFQPEAAQFLNKTDAAEFFGVSRRTIHEWVKRGYGPKWHKLPGGREVTTLKACEQFVDELSRA